MVKAFTLGDVGGFQEFSDLEDRQTLMRLATERDWGWYMPATGGGETTPVVWNRARFRLIDGQTIKAHDAVPDMTPARYINVVRLREIATGKVFGIINTHTIAQASFDAQLTRPQADPAPAPAPEAAARRDRRPLRDHRARVRDGRPQRQLPRRPGPPERRPADVGAR